jgi:hypothetical protein
MQNASDAQLGDLKNCSPRNHNDITKLILFSFNLVTDVMKLRILTFNFIFM